MMTYPQLWNLLKRTAFALLIMLGFFVCIELFRIFAMFYKFHPYLGYAFAVGFVTLTAVLFFPLRRRWQAIPRALKPPPLPDEEPTFKQRTRYATYLLRYLDRLAENPYLREESRALAFEAADKLAALVSGHPLPDALAQGINEIEQEVMHPLLDELEIVAERDLRAGVRDIMLGVSLSPYHSMDLLIVLYRNASIVFQVAKTFQGRPLPHEQFLILVDVMKVVATVNFMNISKSLFESLFNKMPIVGRVVEDMGEGLGAGLFTSAAGHAAIYRCAAYQGWSRTKATETMLAQTKQFLDDVRNIFLKDVLPNLKHRILSTSPEKAAEPGFWDSVVQSVQAAVDTTAQAVDSYVIQPTVSGVAKAGSVVGNSMARAARRPPVPPKPAPEPEPAPAPPPETAFTKPARRKHRRRPPKGIVRVLRTAGQRLRYSLLGPKR